MSRGEAARSFLLADFEGEMLGFLGGIKSFSMQFCGEIPSRSCRDMFPGTAEN